jgi:hypothetical protein
MKQPRDDELSDVEISRRATEALKRALTKPHKPHEPKKAATAKKKPAVKRASKDR